ncbi:Ppx/GppA phosphatase [Georgenia satyanarayanai]|uniref:Ppx/GppA phosphatase n=1 Tax=Georgenia satyanarayanai TaxID=860221 RepID=A0A2Y9A3Y0_9MICO|nr:Ppx/GppA phosphatase family protein [Georgenia satyanarayanai]PYG00891.1 Ppx/GppA phosphatase [Georgenia satyanarayanai]SSA39130.1 Ppx/GppA phosphatase [Georgenia satyanarayanai]
MTRVAAIDCGTNSIRLLIADVSRRGPLVEVTRQMEVVRLGQGVDRTGMLDPAALGRTLTAVRRYAEICAEHRVESIRFVATSATRDAGNRHTFVDGVRTLLGVEPEVVSGQEEAALSFAGAASVIGSEQPRPLLVVDIGGGSTELVVGDDVPRTGVSLDMGSVRLTERHLRADPPTGKQVRAARQDVRDALAEAAREISLAEVRTVVGVAGSVTTVTAHALDLPEYDRSRIDGAELPTPAVLASCEALLHATREERAAMGFMHPGRVDVIGAGALIWGEVVSAVQRATGNLPTVRTSEHDILDGIALSLR